MISCLYHPPSQSSKKFESFSANFEHLLSDSNVRKSSISLTLGNFEARSTCWWFNDIDSAKETKLFWLSTSNGFHQIIIEPMHTQRNSSSCINLIFTDQPRLVIINSVQASLHSSCHYQIIHCTLNPNIVYPLLINAYFRTRKRLMFQIYKKLYNWWTRTNYLITKMLILKFFFPMALY